MAKKPSETPVAPVAKRKPRISVLERRLQNPFGEPSAPVEFKESGWIARWFNGGKSADHVWRNQQKGWEKVRPDELADIEQIGGYSVTPDGYVARGERQSEILLKMPADWYARIQRAKSEHNDRLLRPGAQKAELLNAAAGALGDEAANLMNKAMVIGDVKTTREIVQRDQQGE